MPSQKQMNVALNTEKIIMFDLLLIMGRELDVNMGMKNDSTWVWFYLTRSS